VSAVRLRSKKLSLQSTAKKLAVTAVLVLALSPMVALEVRGATSTGLYLMDVQPTNMFYDCKSIIYVFFSSES